MSHSPKQRAITAALSAVSRKFAENKALNIWILRKKALPLHRFLKFRVMGN